MSSDHTEKLVSLSQVILSLNNEDEVSNFFRDLCTPIEIKSLKERWTLCQLLAKDELSYREIHKMTGASLTTIGRVARFLRAEPNGGYRKTIKSLQDEN